MTASGDVAAVPQSEKRWKNGDRVGGGWHGGHDGQTDLLDIEHAMLTSCQVPAKLAVEVSS